MTLRRAVFAPSGMGPLALEAHAFGATFDAVEVGPLVASGERLAVVPVRGPLMHHESPDFLSYELLQAWVRCEIAGGARAIILELDTPGGLVSGVFETARTIRDECRAAGVLLVAYVGNQCSSAGYALACAASLIVAPPASSTGSIGVIEALQDSTRAAALAGQAFVLITSGARKADGHPLAGISEDAVRARQTHVDDLAGVFFDWVAANRNLKAEQVRALEAGSFAGARAVALGLVDRVQDFEGLKKDLARQLDSPDSGADSTPAAASAAPLPEEKPMSAARKALQAIADDEKMPEKDRDEARAALKALGDGDGDEEPKKDDDKAEDSGGDDDKKKDDDDKKDAEAAAAASPALAALVTKQVATAQAPEAEQRKRLLATRPDFSAELAKTLQTQPLAVVRHYVNTIPRSPVGQARAALDGTARPALAAPQAGGPPAQSAEVQPRFQPAAFAHSTIADRGFEVSFSAVRPRRAASAQK